jgi:hypothetical protein
MRVGLLISENDSWVRLRRDPESKSGIFPVRRRNNHVALFLSRRKGAARANRLRHDVATVGERRAAPAGMPAPRKGIVHVRRRDPIRESARQRRNAGFPRGYGSRQCLEHRNSRFRFAHVGACAVTAVAVRGRAECLQRLLLKAQTVAVASEAMMSEWRRRVGLNASILNDSKMRMPIGRAGRPPLWHLVSSTRAHRRLRAAALGAPPGCMAIPAFAADMAEPADLRTARSACHRTDRGWFDQVMHNLLRKFGSMPSWHEASRRTHPALGTAMRAVIEGFWISVNGSALACRTAVRARRVSVADLNRRRLTVAGGYHQ